MSEIYECNLANGGQHFWIPIISKGIQCYSCPMCQQMTYWSDTLLKWVKPATTGDKPIKGNQPKKDSKGQEDVNE